MKLNGFFFPKRRLMSEPLIAPSCAGETKKGVGLANACGALRSSQLYQYSNKSGDVSKAAKKK
jgi:hypothetical protein